LKGLAITSESAFNPGNGGFVYVNPTQTNFLGNPTGAGLVIYYNDSLSVTFPVNRNNNGSSSRRVNTYYHVTTQTTVPHTYAYTSSLSNTDTCFIQAMGRYKMMIKIPYLYELAGKHHIAVNSAELIVKPYTNSISSQYYAPL